jgi:hypothetical protein
MALNICDSSKLKKGDHLFEVCYYVFDHNDDEYTHVIDRDGGKIQISRSIVDKFMACTSQHTTEKKVTRTELSALIEGLGHTSFRVTFRKQVVPNDIADAIDGKDLSTQAKRRKVMKELMEGEERVMHAKLLRSKEFDAAMELGRYKVIDLDALKPGEDAARAIRMVDTRTISEVVAEGIRYYV